MLDYTGYLYTIKCHKGVYIASRACENILFIPQTIEEFHLFLFNDRVLEMLCNLKVSKTFNSILNIILIIHV